jgi:hypothetical protein
MEMVTGSSTYTKSLDINGYRFNVMGRSSSTTSVDF